MTDPAPADLTPDLAATPGASSPPLPGRRAIVIGALVSLLASLFGIKSWLQILTTGLARPQEMNVFFRLYALHERSSLFILLLASVALLLATRQRAGAAWRPALRPPTERDALLIGAAVFALATAVWFTVMHGLLLSMDEFTADFQARVFASGRLEAPVAATWQPFIHAMQPVFVVFSPESGRWFSNYLPVFSLLRAPFVALGAGALMNPLLGAFSIVLIWAIARRLWPGDAVRQWAALVMLGTSSQFLVTSSTGYAMPAHLCLDLLWLWLWLRGDVRSWAAALGVGVLALGLHSPFPHALFVAPFMLRLLRERRWGRLASAAVVYGVAAFAFLLFLRHVQPAARNSSALAAVFALPSGPVLWLNAVDVTLLFTWQMPLFGALAVAGALQGRRLPGPLADLGLGVVITIAFYCFFPFTQGHGWGYRYAYQVLGSLALLAAAGVPVLLEAMRGQRARWLLAASIAVALVIQLPLRLQQVARFSAPYARAYAFVGSRNADVVLVHGDSIWYGRDLIRNDPFLRAPAVVAAGALTPAQRDSLERAHPGRVVDVPDGDLLSLGLTAWTSH